MHLSARLSCILWQTAFSGRRFISRKCQKKSGPHTTSTALSTTVSFVTGVAPNGHLLELLVGFSLHAELDRFENMVHRHLGLVRWLGALLEDTDARQDRIPRILRFARFVKPVGAANVRLGRVACEVNGIWRLVDTVSIFPPLLG
jgi:hypothetical protein